jgi:predicted component of type VI protein secretion system
MRRRQRRACAAEIDLGVALATFEADIVALRGLLSARTRVTAHSAHRRMLTVEGQAVAARLSAAFAAAVVRRSVARVAVAVRRWAGRGDEGDHRSAVRVVGADQWP